MNTKRNSSIGDLYPNLTHEQQERAAANIRRYIQIICRIHARIRAEGKHWPTPAEARRVYGFPSDLTEPGRDANVRSKVESP
jgi:hypothetical protein